MTGPEPSATCLNCAAPLHGAWCHVCGQRHRAGALPLRELVAEGLEEVVGAGSRLASTVLALLLRPGRVTEEYLAGRRIRYVGPVRLYLTASVAFGAALVFADSTVVISLEGAEAPDRAIWLRYWLWTVLFMMPAFAGLLRLAFPRDRLFSEHVVFTLHFLTVAYVVAAVCLPVVELLEGTAAGGITFLLLPLVILIHLIASIRRVYAASWLRTVTTAIVLSLAYGILQLVALVGTGFVIDRLLRSPGGS